MPARSSDRSWEGQVSTVSTSDCGRSFFVRPRHRVEFLQELGGGIAVDLRLLTEGLQDGATAGSVTRVAGAGVVADPHDP